MVEVEVGPGEEGARCAQCGSSSIVHENHEGEELMVRVRGRGRGVASRHHAFAKNGRPGTTPIRDLCPRNVQLRN